MNASNTSAERTDFMKVLVIDDERLSSHNLGIQLKFVGESPMLCSSENWREAAEAQGEDVLLAAVVGVIKHADSAALLSALQEQYPELGIILISSQAQPAPGTLPVADRVRVQILDAKAVNYETMSAALRSARELKGLAPRELHSKVISRTGSALFRSLSGKSPAIQKIRELVQQVAKRDVTVLVLGESGTGKEVVARNLHYHSGRGQAAFIAVNCATIAPERYGVELFGEEGGAEGLLERADGGTLYLDEVAELPLNTQTLLLRFLEDKCFRRSGGSEMLRTDVRVVAATAQKLQRRIQQGLFRSDLFYRLNLMPIELPPLRRRLEDIPELVRELLKNLESRGYTPITLNAAALDALQHHGWPGNVRELANLIERLCIMHSEGVIGVNDLPLEYQHSADTDALLQEIEALTTKVEEKVAGSRSAARPESQPVQANEGAAPAASPAPPPVSDAAAGLPAGGQTGKPDASAPSVVLNDTLLQQYLYNFEKQLLMKALDDSANILSFAAERLDMPEGELTLKMQTYKLQPV